MAASGAMTPSEFAAKWKGSTRTERAASQEHFIDICRMLDVKTPNEADPTGAWYAFEKGVEKQSGGDGFADVWKRDHFAWEYKGKRKNLADAYTQLLQYREALDNPPCLVVCDLDRFEIHTNFTGTRKVVHSFDLEAFHKSPAEPLRVLRAALTEPEKLRPAQTVEQVTEEAAGQFAELAERLRSRGHKSQEVAHFLLRLLFCFFAEDVTLLPKGLLKRLLASTRTAPDQFTGQIGELFGLMSQKDGKRHFGVEPIQWFNGGLFDDATVLPLKVGDLEPLIAAAKLDWSSVEPAILGTLFERGLNPAKRGQLGAHYTDRASIRRVVEPVVLQPLRLEFEAMKDKVSKLLAAGKKATSEARGKDNPNRVFRAFLERLRAVRVLDPACGSGNFLYITLQLLKDLEKEAILWGAETMKTTQELPGVGPEAVLGIEFDPYAAELARVTIWIGEIQWMLNNGFHYRTNPVLRSLETVRQGDAILDRSDPENPRRVDWPEAEFIIGNPPFLGGKKLRASLGDAYVDALFAAWDTRVPREADLVSYWHEKAREEIEANRAKRAGLLATQSIRAGANRKVLAKIKETGDIFMAWSDEPWVVEGADVRVSIVAQDDGTERERRLDGQRVDVIYADLKGGTTGGSDLTTARALAENAKICFMGDTKGGPFDVPIDVARKLTAAGPNTNGRPNSEVVVPWMNALDLVRRSREMYVIDFGVDMTEAAASLYEAPFEYIRKEVRPIRIKNNREAYARKWWLHVEPRPELRTALTSLTRFLVTPRVASHRLFAFVHSATVPDSRLYAFARSDDYFFGVLHSRAHEAWALATSSRHGVGNDPTYNNTTCFETFPFPWPLNTPEKQLTKEQRAQMAAIASAAKELDAVRSKWLNPPELVKPAPGLAPTFPQRLIPKDADAATTLKARTLTDLYNARPAWLDGLHRKLDAAIFAAYGWPADISETEILARVLALNQERVEKR
jgi:type II restriction/modification system DNA methylase subunit YeeA